MIIKWNQTGRSRKSIFAVHRLRADRVIRLAVDVGDGSGTAIVMGYCDPLWISDPDAVKRLAAYMDSLGMIGDQGAGPGAEAVNNGASM